MSTILGPVGHPRVSAAAGALEQRLDRAAGGEGLGHGALGRASAEQLDGVLAAADGEAEQGLGRGEIPEIEPQISDLHPRGGVPHDAPHRLPQIRPGAGGILQSDLCAGAQHPRHHGRIRLLG